MTLAVELAYLDLVQTIGSPRESPKVEGLYTRWYEHDYAGMCEIIASHMSIEKPVKYVREDEADTDALAWVPHSDEATIHVRENRMDQLSFGAATYVCAHECAHIALCEKHSPLWCIETAVDIATMILGFSPFVLGGRMYITSRWRSPRDTNPPSLIYRILEAMDFVDRRIVGYISEGECMAIARLICIDRKLRKRAS